MARGSKHFQSYEQNLRRVRWVQWLQDEQLRRRGVVAQVPTGRTSMPAWLGDEPAAAPEQTG